MSWHLNPLENYYEKFTRIDLETVVEISIHFLLRKPEGEDIEDISLDAIFSEDDSDVSGDDSESDGYLSEVVERIFIP